MKRPQTKFHADAICDSKVIRSKKVKIYRWVKISYGIVFSMCRYFIKATLTDIDMFLQL